VQDGDMLAGASEGWRGNVETELEEIFEEVMSLAIKMANMVSHIEHLEEALNAHKETDCGCSSPRGSSSPA